MTPSGINPSYIFFSGSTSEPAGSATQPPPQVPQVQESPPPHRYHWVNQPGRRATVRPMSGQHSSQAQAVCEAQEPEDLPQTPPLHPGKSQGHTSLSYFLLHWSPPGLDWDPSLGRSISLKGPTVCVCQKNLTHYFIIILTLPFLVTPGITSTSRAFCFIIIHLLLHPEWFSTILSLISSLIHTFC